HAEFDSFVVELGPVADSAGFIEALTTIISAHAVLRLTGFVDVSGKPMRLQLQAVGSRSDHYFERAWGASEKRATRLVGIGLHEMDQDAVRAASEALV
ncbi:GTP-binding protein, partial [Rhizobium ruizarguesonis]